ncbi:MAG: hypothetical protein AAF556_10670 [Pseudomonadota bacterium]
MADNQPVAEPNERSLFAAIGVRSAVLLAVAAGGVGAMVLTSGPDSSNETLAIAPTPEAVQVTVIGSPEDIAPDAPVQQLGVGEEGDWRRGVITRHIVSLTDEVRLPTLSIDASAITPGRYHYGGDVVLVGDLTQNYVEITAQNITVDGDIRTDNVRLMTIEDAPVRDKPDMMFFGRGNNSIGVLTGWDHHYHRGDAIIGGSIIGDQIDVVASRISVGRDVIGEVDLAASGGEWTDAVLTNSHGQPTESFQLYRDESIGPDQFNESIRMGLQKPEDVIQIGGTVEGDVSQIIPRMWASEHGFTQPTAASIAAAAAEQAAVPTHQP